LTRLVLDRVACRRGGRMLFDAVHVALDTGDAALVTGPNGVGKSSLIRIAAGLLHAAAGTVTRDGAVALLGEAHALDPELVLARALAFWIGDRTETAMAAVGLADLAAVPVRILSTGQRRRAGLARIVGAAAPIWLLDEPANGLDSDGVTQVEALVAAHRAAGGIVVVATHQPIALPGAVAVRLG
jgi:heme exporter protein A